MRIWLRQKKAGNDLKKHYLLIFQISLVTVLGVCLLVFNLGTAGNRNITQGKETTDKKQETIQIKEVVRTKQKNQPPRPPSPQTPVEVPDNELVKTRVNKDLNQIDQQISSGKKMAMPSPPNKDKEEEKVFTIVEKEPRLIGGLDTLQQMINYPGMAQKAEIQGRVYVQFIVNKKGEVINPKVIRGPGAGLNKEALRVIKKARFRPGIQQGHPVRVKYTMPIVFRLDAFNRS